MSKSEDLTKFSTEQMREFLSSFDIVLSDIDGVLWYIDGSIEEAPESLAELQNLGKQVYLVTNNNIVPIDYYCQKSRQHNLNLNPDNVINISKVIIWYLKKINFHGEVFAFASEELQNTLKEAGIKLTENPQIVPSNYRTTLKQVLDRPSVKAVITDFDVNCNWAKYALAVSCLKREDVLYITGAMDETITTYCENNLLGPGPLMRIVAIKSGRKPTACGKPSQILKDYILETCNITDPRRCLFIGDTVNQDMKFATMCGFRKLFVGTGCDTLEMALKEEDNRPDFYLPNLNQLFSAFKNS